MRHRDIKLKGQDIGIIAGRTLKVAPGGVFLYKPTNELIPNRNMSGPELQECFRQCISHVKIPYSTIRQVNINSQPVWRNRDLFDLNSMNIDPYDQVYWGRGNIAVELRGDLEEVEVLAEEILIKDTGLQRMD